MRETGNATGAGEPAGAVLLTGGAGFIGSHVAAELMARGRRVVILDSFLTSHPGVIARLERLGHGQPELVTADIRNARALDRLFATRRIGAVVHLAGLKAVGESVTDPLGYFDVNVAGTLTLLRAMQRHGVRDIVFSSSATVYAAPGAGVTENAPLGALNPYGRSKLMVERMLGDLAAAGGGVSAISLRYFNPVGAHPGGLLGEDPRLPPTNLFPCISRAALGTGGWLKVFGTDWPTPDGTGVRDYIHIMDLARGHAAALERIGEAGFAGRHVPVNLGTGRGYSVLEAIAAIERASGRAVPHDLAPRRPGDAAECTADPGLALGLLGWRAELGLDEMARDHWAYASAAGLPGIAA